jgi:ribosomal protein S18 acetylase RimI-like enzyme
VSDGDRAARRFLALATPRLPPWVWPATWRHLAAARRMSPVPPPRAWYVDALAVDPAARRRGVARALLRAAEDQARATGSPGVALDTGLDNEAGQALYEAEGFQVRGHIEAPDDRTAAALGGRGFVAYFKPLEPRT